MHGTANASANASFLHGFTIQKHIYGYTTSKKRMSLCERHQYGAPLRPWRYKSLRVSAVRDSGLHIRDRMNLR
eukprot:145882-Pleurochrysis_carterae.AAC.1